MTKSLAFPENAAYSDYLDLIQYFAKFWKQNIDTHGTRVHYPGMPSVHGLAMDGLEGFARLCPLLGQHLHLKMNDGTAEAEDLESIALLKCGILAGTDPDSLGYWGDIVDGDQRVVEAADIALAIYLTKEVLWDTRSPAEQAQVERWLTGALQHWVTPNNWLLFVALIGAVLANLTGTEPHATATRSFNEFLTFYLGDGWFSDGNPENGVVLDWYNSDQIHYTLYFLRQLHPAFSEDFLEPALQEFGRAALDLATPTGPPIFGRSVCYRLAIPTASILAARTNNSLAGEARRALDVTWSHYLEHGALVEGVPTQGLYEEDLNILDLYSGPASALWGTRSLVAALQHGPTDPFWATSPMPLPVEVGTFDYYLASPRLHIYVNHELDFTSIERHGGFRDHRFSVERRLKDRIKGIRFYNGRIVTLRNRRAHACDRYGSNRSYWK